MKKQDTGFGIQDSGKAEYDKLLAVARAADDLMATLGAYGEIDTTHPKTQKLLDALSEWKPVGCGEPANRISEKMEDTGCDPRFYKYVWADGALRLMEVTDKRDSIPWKEDFGGKCDEN